MKELKKWLISAAAPALMLLTIAVLFTTDPLRSFGDGVNEVVFNIETPSELGEGEIERHTASNQSYATATPSEEEKQDPNSENYDPVYIITFADDAGREITRETIQKSWLDNYGGYYAAVAVDAVEIPAENAFGGWQDSYGNSLYSYSYAGMYFVNIYPAGDMLIKLNLVPEDYFIEDEVYVFTNEKVVLEEGE